jgi:hypothetical protein
MDGGVRRISSDITVDRRAEQNYDAFGVIVRPDRLTWLGGDRQFEYLVGLVVE